MSISKSSIVILNQLCNVLEQLSDDAFIRPVNHLNNSTIGQHARHTIEFLLCLEDGYGSGNVNYDERDHDTTIETNRVLAIELINRLTAWLKEEPADKAFRLQVSYDPEGDLVHTVRSSFDRELVYNIEHAIHHMALIKVGLKEVAPEIQPDPSFGIAVSTLRHRKQKIETSGR